MSGCGRAQRTRRFSVVAVFAALTLIGLAANSWAQLGSLGATHPAPATGLFGWLLVQQGLFYQALARIIRQAKTDGSAYWTLIGISFAYGVFHAAGPGHGKAVISSYLLANEETWRRGIALSFASAVLQSLTAVAIVAIAALLIGATAKMMGDTVRIIETASYLLIIIIGTRMLWVKGKSFRAAWRDIRDQSAPTAHVAVDGRTSPHHQHSHDEHAHHDHCNNAHAHHHAHGNDEDDVLPWAHGHGPEPEELAGTGGWRRGLSAVIAVGLRPCSGAIIVLVFALAQGLLWAGIASTFVMGLGTAITVGAIASLTVGAKSLAKRLASGRAGYGALALRGVEVAAACLVMLVGVALLTGYMASERMGFF